MIEVKGWVKVGVAGLGDSESSSDVLICHRQVMEGDMLACEDRSQTTIVAMQALSAGSEQLGIDRLYTQGGKIR